MKTCASGPVALRLDPQDPAVRDRAAQKGDLALSGQQHVRDIAAAAMQRRASSLRRTRRRCLAYDSRYGLRLQRAVSRPAGPDGGLSAAAPT